MVYLSFINNEQYEILAKTFDVLTWLLTQCAFSEQRQLPCAHLFFMSKYNSTSLLIMKILSKTLNFRKV